MAVYRVAAAAQREPGGGVRREWGRERREQSGEEVRREALARWGERHTGMFDVHAYTYTHTRTHTCAVARRFIDSDNSSVVVA